ncbi:hypothetical protein MalM25_09560 [Planctomycetes bacterium MalM25]|nr:hypothetical protein MalM25_09560 [Planctomycetes bacterium MalM25]
MTPFILLLITAAGDPSPAAVETVRYETEAPVSAPAPNTPTETAPASFQQRLAALDLALSKTVVESPERWRLDRLRREADTLRSEAANATERAAAAAIADRIDRFASISRRHRNLAATADGWRKPDRLAKNGPDASPRVETRSRLAPQVRLTKSSAGSRHDASGVLRPVVSKRPGAPKYAVVDDKGRIAALVTPTEKTEPRLAKLVGKRVGLNGQRGYLTDLKREHVVAERVTPLSTLRR